MTWHDHSNETDKRCSGSTPRYSMVQILFDASFAEGLSEDQQPITKPAGDSFARYGMNLLPVDASDVKTSPIFNSPIYTREALDRRSARRVGRLPRAETEILQSKPAILRCRPSALHPALAGRFQDRAYRSTDATVFARSKAKAGRGSASRPSNGPARPVSWCRAGMVPTRPSRIRAVQLSDRPVQQKLDLFRADRGNA